MNKKIVEIPKILLPKTDLNKWSVVACDQFNASPAYWENLKSYVGDSPSALNVVFPEIYLSDDNSKRIESINKTMQEYVNGDLFREFKGFILLERKFLDGNKRVGLMLAVDLDSYSWERVNVPIRATEDTIQDRLPVRVAIRKNAPLELPHILLLIDDQEKTVIENLYKNREKLEKLYDFDLNMDGGHLTGYGVSDTASTLEALYALTDGDLQIKKYGYDADVMFFVGDGNHSLATAKVHWENLKAELSEEERQNHPARYALVEVVNVYGEGMDFLPIHRVLFGKDREEIKQALFSKLNGENGHPVDKGDCIFGYETDKSCGVAIKTIQTAVEELIKEGVKVEYVHGDDHLKSAVAELTGVGISMPKFLSNELFPYVLKEGNLPKKAFSIGSAEEKKYYVECRKIK